MPIPWAPTATNPAILPPSSPKPYVGYLALTVPLSEIATGNTIVWDGSLFSPAPVPPSVYLSQTLSGTVNSINTAFVLPRTPVHTFAVYKDGMRCVENLVGALGYSYDSTTLTVTFNTAPVTFAAADIA
jgi:hypothetical protein